MSDCRGIAVKLKNLVLAGLAAVFLAACDSVEERAEAHYESGLALIEEGDPERALLELRNVFDLTPGHREARALYARTAQDLGRTREAYGQYLRLVEQYPNDVEGRLSLAQMAFDSQNWQEFERHGTVAVEAVPEDPRAQIIEVGLAYRTAMSEDDATALAAVLDRARALSEQVDASPILRAVLIDGYALDGRYAEALTEVDAALADAPDSRAYHDIRLSLLARMGDKDGTERQLITMTETFPEDQSIKGMLIRYYLGENQADKAEAFMRDLADPTAEDLDPFFSLVSFLLQTQGADAARAELEKGLEAVPGSVRMNTALATLDFENGRRQEAISRLETLLDQSDPDTRTSEIQVPLAKMLQAEGNDVGARRLVEQVLSEDAGNAEALKMQATWLTRADDVDGAVNALRRALDSEPDDAEAMTLMAAAYTRGGSHELARDFLSLAVEASGNRPAEAIRYARSLLEGGRVRPAEDTLLAALRGAPNDVSLLIELGRLYLDNEENSRVRQIIGTLRRVGNDTADAAAVGLEAALVGRTQSVDQVLDFLEGMQTGGDGNIATTVALMQAHLAAGQREEAQQIIDEALAETPDAPQFRFLDATMQAVNGDLAGAEESLRALVQDEPGVPQIWLELSRVLAARGMPDEAEQVIEAGRAANPEDPSLQWAMATTLQRAGDFDGAIAIYEDLYARSSSSIIVANNLASLLTTYRDDPESLERAFTIARRLRDTRQPAFQDTYGWILYRRGNFEEALEYLEPAAAGMGDDALVQYHLAKTYLALERPEDALEQFRRAVTIAGAIDTRPQIEEARAEINRLQRE